MNSKSGWKPWKPALESKSESEEPSGPWRPTKWQVLWAIGMVVALLTTALLIVNLRPDIWKGLLEERQIPLLAIGVSLTAIIVLLAIGAATSGWTGFRGKTVWDWMDLLIVPMVLVGIGLLFEMQQADRQQATEKRQQALAEQQAQDEALQAYLDQMGLLMLDRRLLQAEQGDPVHTLAQARTSTIIARLDAERNESVIRFLIDSGLAGTPESSVRLLEGIDLHRTRLSEADLDYAAMLGADLRNADLHGAHLQIADLRGADLQGADLRGADLAYANLSADDKMNFGADLSNTDLSFAHFTEANLSYAFLTEANLSHAFLTRANLSNTDLSNADLSNADLMGAKGITSEELEQQAASLEGATMPNGQKYEDWRKD